jgi:hypothetical protein
LSLPRAIIDRNCLPRAIDDLKKFLFRGTFALQEPATLNFFAAVQQPEKFSVKEPASVKILFIEPVEML